MPGAIIRAEVAARLRDIREAINPNATEFAKRAGIAQNAWSQYETGERLITLGPAVRLCDEYRLSLDWIYRGDRAFIPGVILEKLGAAEEKPQPRRAKGGRR